MIVGEEPHSISCPVIDHASRSGRLDAGVCTRRPGLGLHHVGDVLAVVEHPVLELRQPFLAPIRPDGLPVRLEEAQLTHPLGDLIGRIDLHLADDPSMMAE